MWGVMGAERTAGGAWCPGYGYCPQPRGGMVAVLGEAVLVRLWGSGVHVPLDLSLSTVVLFMTLPVSRAETPSSWCVG